MLTKVEPVRQLIESRGADGEPLTLGQTAAEIQEILGSQGTETRTGSKLFKARICDSQKSGVLLLTKLMFYRQ